MALTTNYINYDECVCSENGTMFYEFSEMRKFVVFECARAYSVT